MDVLDAAYRTVHGYPGGAVSLAPRMGKRPASLSHEVRPPVGSAAKLGLLDAITIMEFANDLSIMHAMASRMGGMFIPLTASLDDADDAGTRVGRVAQEFAELMAEVLADTADGKITGTELRRIHAAWGELMAEGQRMLAHCQALHEADQPRSEHGGR